MMKFFLRFASCAILILWIAIAARAESITLNFDMSSSCTGGLTVCSLSTGQNFGTIVFQDGIINRNAGQPEHASGINGVRITVHTTLPMQALMFSAPGKLITADNDFILDGTTFPIVTANHLPNRGEFFSGGTNFNVGPFGHFNSQLTLNWKADMQFDVFSLLDSTPIFLSDLLTLSETGNFRFCGVCPVTNAIVQARSLAGDRATWVAAAPEPSAFLLLSTGVLCLWGLRRRGRGPCSQARELE